MILPDETEAVCGGYNHAEGYSWAHRDDADERGKSLFALVTKTHRIGRSLCLENPRSKAGTYSPRSSVIIAINSYFVIACRRHNSHARR